MSLVKIPCILVAMVGLQIAVTPPHPPPSSIERVASTKWEVIVKQRSGPLVVKAICWGAAVAETAVIAANASSSWAPSRCILSTLVISGSPEKISITPLFLVGTLMAAFGGFIRYHCYRVLGNMFTFEMSIRKDHRLITTGPYSFVRHPGYTGVILTIGGIICCHAAPGSWARECGALGTRAGQGAAGTFLATVTLVITGLMSRMSREDEALRKEFGKDWIEWARRVPCKLVPGIY